MQKRLIVLVVALTLLAMVVATGKWLYTLGYRAGIAKVRAYVEQRETRNASPYTWMPVWNPASLVMDCRYLGFDVIGLTHDLHVEPPHCPDVLEGETLTLKITAYGVYRLTFATGEGGFGSMAQVGLPSATTSWATLALRFMYSPETRQWEVIINTTELSPF
jgi:hypothetical protein